MELREAMRVALACTIDTARNLPHGKTKDRVTNAARRLRAAVEHQTEIAAQETTARDIILGKAGPDVC